MRIQVLQHTPNEGPGSIQRWSAKNGHQMTVYHPAHFNGVLPAASETDLLVILGSPMSPNDHLPWIRAERELIAELLAVHKPIFGACFGAQQIAKTMGATVVDAPYMEVGWELVEKKSQQIPNLPDQLTALHWHEQMFTLPEGAELLFSTDWVKNQGFVVNNVIGLQFHFEPLADNLREMVANDGQYPANPRNVLKQTGADILAHGVPAENEQVMFMLLDYLVTSSQ